MFTGIDEVDWASLRHAYGSAEDVPPLLRGLASADAVERETALDGLYGAVHHEGRVYDSTLACVPFLFSLAVRAEVPDRAGIVELLASIGAGGAGAAGGGAPAREAVSSGAEAFVPLAADADARVRRAAAGALVLFLDDRPARVLGLLRQRLLVERDDAVLLAVTEAVGLFARRHPGHAAPAVDLLATRSAPPYGPGLRLAALGQLARMAPDRLSAGLVPTAVRLLRERSALRAAESGGPREDTLVARIRRLRPSDEEGSRLLGTLHSVLGDRVDDRIALLTGQLTSPDPRDRGNGVWMSAGLFRGLRADHRRPVALLGAQLASDHAWLRDAAVSVLAELFGLAAPAADALHTLVTARPDLWTQRWDGGPPTLGGPLRALARSGDQRAVPVLAQVLDSTAVPVDLGREVVPLGRAAAPLAPALRRRLGLIPLDDPAAARLARPLLAAVGAVGDREAVPEVLRLLSGGPDGPGGLDGIAGPAIATLEAMGAAAQAAPLLRRFLHTRHAAAAASALWSAEGDAAAVLPSLLRELTERRQGGRRPAAEVLGRLGPAARTALPELRRTAESGRATERAWAACAWGRIEPDPEPVLPVLRTAWTEDPAARGPIAGCLAEMGPSAAALRDLVATELAAVRRHNARETGHGSHDIAEDEALLRACREVMAAL
ncbi:HEAT repeat domain-containing protein [Streptomyces sp. NPDC047028]|uniref:HEAT repeat domain-containing protein n=1 Tax=Streptomyces sp. NPDC047028 TaxID=3155793 RepID=UPI0033DF4F72